MTLRAGHAGQRPRLRGVASCFTDLLLIDEGTESMDSVLDEEMFGRFLGAFFIDLFDPHEREAA